MDPDGTTLIHELLRQSAGNVLSEHELLCEVRTFLIAGHDTTSSMLASCVLLLAQYPEFQQELVDELATVDLEDYDTLSKMPLLNAVINEVLHLFPSAFWTFREMGEDGVTAPTTVLEPLELPERFHIETPIVRMIDLVHRFNEVLAQRIVDRRHQIGNDDF
ncbi:hypothetical protein AMAG_19554 [Allomyces macrogynus ATCC 38327]|uniref:Cytochrome P450 n=1 Tax=Allomyces macrogynus (strain ATCC 38327) TaxID=578462 RepID=A0A0L0SXB7_ALLM3|nr:hypothetical protein AMAG_19554 [Allomyces macrogynus ATCC 38327]|eukprot:KNE66974.1 hypothetical protein AMAG_19554 [Allomyces macrogynus ATCC 38327]